MNVLIDGGRDRDPRGLAYIHTELSHQHTGYSAGHTLCASGSPFTHAVSSSALTSPADPRVYCARAILYVCRRTRSDAGRRARPGGWQCLNLDGGGLALAGESSHWRRKLDKDREWRREREREREGGRGSCVCRMVYFKTFIVVYFLSSGDDMRLLGFRCSPPCLTTDFYIDSLLRFLFHVFCSCSSLLVRVEVNEERVVKEM